MNLVRELTAGYSIPRRDKIVRYIGTDKKRFKELVDIFLGDNYRMTQHAGWPLSYVVEQHPEMIRPHLKKMLKDMDRPGLHEAVRRSTLRLLQFIDIPPNLAGLAFEKSLTLLTDIGQPIAVKVFAMSVLSNMAMKEPDLVKEVIIVIEEQLPYGSAAYRSRAAKELKRLRKLV